MSVLDAAAKSAGPAGHCRRSLRPCASCTRLRLSPACFVFSGLEVEHGSMTCAITKRWSKKRVGTFCLCLRHRHVRGPLCTVSRLSPMLPAARESRDRALLIVAVRLSGPPGCFPRRALASMAARRGVMPEKVLGVSSRARHARHRRQGTAEPPDSCPLSRTGMVMWQAWAGR